MDMVACCMDVPVYSQNDSASIAAVDSDSTAVFPLPRLKENHKISGPVLPDSADLERNSKKHFWRAASETVGFNIGLWAFDRYVLDGHYAYI